MAVCASSCQPVRGQLSSPRSDLMIVGDIVKYRNTGTVGRIRDVIVEGEVTWALLDTSKLYYDVTALDPASEDEYRGAADRERESEGPTGGPRPPPPRNGRDGREGLQDHSHRCGLGPLENLTNPFLSPFYIPMMGRAFDVIGCDLTLYLPKVRSRYPLNP